MKLILLKCPGCGADINVEAGRKFIFCEYCGQKIFVDDEVQRTEHTENINVTYRQIDEAKLREADARIKEAEIRERKDLRKEQKRVAKKKRNRFVLLAILLLIGFGVVKSRIAQQRSDAYANKIGKQVKEVCDDHGVSVDKIRVSGSKIDIDILAASAQKDDIDAIQNAVVDAVTVKDGYKLSVSFEYPENHVVRKISVNEYGKIDIDSDYTNTLSSEEITKLITSFEEKLPEGLDEKIISLEKVSFEGDTVKIDLLSETREKEKADNILSQIKDISAQLGNPKVYVHFEDGDGDTLRNINLSESGKVEISDDNCNSISDDEVAKIEKEYVEAVKAVCLKSGSTLSSVKMSGDVVHIVIAAKEKKKEIADNIETSLDDAVKNLTTIEQNIRITTDNRYSTVREWTVDTNGIHHVKYDYT